MATSSNEHRARLAARLRALRAATDQSGAGFAKHLQDTGAAGKWGQSKVSKLERGTQLPTRSDLQAWASHTDPDSLSELIALLAAARVEYSSFRGIGRTTTLAGEQARIEQVEAGLTWIDEYQPSLIPGLAQTGEYSAAVFALPPAAHDPVDMADAVKVRRRRADVLFDSKRRTRLIVGEAALWASPGSLNLLKAQLVHLEQLSALPAVEFGVLPLRAMPVLPVSGFRIYDDDRAVLESISGEHLIPDPEDVRRFTDGFALLRAHALLGTDAVQRVREVLDQLTIEEGHD